MSRVKKFQLALHIFRRDLRLVDNSALLEALALSEQVIPCFIFDPRQVDKNPYKGEHSLAFMAHSLRELDADLNKKGSKLYFYYGKAEEIVAKLIRELTLDAVFVNRDYTPFSQERDKAIEHACIQSSVSFNSYADALLHEPEAVLKSDGKPYTVFTPFYHKAMQLNVPLPRKSSYQNFYNKKIPFEDTSILTTLLRLPIESLSVKGGRSEGLQLIHRLVSLSDYEKARDFPGVSGTSHLSAHHKFGTVSIREVYNEVVRLFGTSHTLVRELFWRDFFTHIGFHFPHVFQEAFHRHYSNLPWVTDKAKFKAWCEGKTGFPIVDAGMRELNQTGYMHNRVRMITASFLVKDLHIDWRWGERYFAEKLVDYDPAVNNGNWQWAASTGCDAQPYFRIFNPWLQQQKFDPECVYIKRYIPEVSHLSSKAIHQLATQRPSELKSYPLPILDHARASQQSKLMYAKAKK